MEKSFLLENIAADVQSGSFYPHRVLGNATSSILERLHKADQLEGLSLPQEMDETLRDIAGVSRVERAIQGSGALSLLEGAGMT